MKPETVPFSSNDSCGIFVIICCLGFFQKTILPAVTAYYFKILICYQFTLTYNFRAFNIWLQPANYPLIRISASSRWQENNIRMILLGVYGTFVPEFCLEVSSSFLRYFKASTIVFCSLLFLFPVIFYCRKKCKMSENMYHCVHFTIISLYTAL